MSYRDLGVTLRNEHESVKPNSPPYFVLQPARMPIMPSPQIPPQQAAVVPPPPQDLVTPSSSTQAALPRPLHLKQSSSHQLALK